MKSKFLNLKFESPGYVGGTDSKEMDANYINKICDATNQIFTYSPNAWLSSYPNTNLLIDKINKEARISVSSTMGANSNNFWNRVLIETANTDGLNLGTSDCRLGWMGFLLSDTINYPGDYRVLSNANSIGFQFNHLNETLMNNLKNGVLYVAIRTAFNRWPFVIKFSTMGAINDMETISSFTATTNGTTNYDGQIIKTNKFNVKDGILWIDQDLLRRFTDLAEDVITGNKTINSGYAVDLFFGTNDTNVDYFSLSQVTICDSINVVMNEGIKYGKKNLNILTRNKKSGTVYRENNSEFKKLEFSMENLTRQEYMEMNKFLEYNKDYPFYAFPYCESNEEAGSYDSLINLRAGGLFNLDDINDINNTQYDFFALKFKLEEHK